MENYISNQCGKDSLFKPRNNKICGRITKLEAIKMHFLAYLQKKMNFQFSKIVYCPSHIAHLTLGM